MKVTDEAQAFLAPILAAYEALDTICVFDSSCDCGSEHGDATHHHLSLSLEAPLPDDIVIPINGHLNVAWNKELNEKVANIVIDYNDAGLFVRQ